jgi:hypothetical protein
LLGCAPQRSDGGEIASSQRHAQSLLCREVPPADAGDHPDSTGEPRAVGIRVAQPGDHHKATPPFGTRQRHQEAASLRGQRVEPDRRQVGHAGIDNDRVSRPVRTERKTVGGNDRCLGPFREIAAGSRSQSRVDLDGGDPASAANDLGKDGAIIT